MGRTISQAKLEPEVCPVLLAGSGREQRPLDWVDWRYEKDASALMLSCVERMLEPLVMSFVSWYCVGRGGLRLMLVF